MMSFLQMLCQYMGSSITGQRTILLLMLPSQVNIWFVLFMLFWSIFGYVEYAVFDQCDINTCMVGI